jgi:hypothetical protein
MGLFHHVKGLGLLLPEADSDVKACGRVYFQKELRRIGETRREFRLVPDPRNEADDPRNEADPGTVNIYDGKTWVGWIGKGRAHHDNCAYADALKLALLTVDEVRVVGRVRRNDSPAVEYKWSIDLRAPDPDAAAGILSSGPAKSRARRIHALVPTGE